MDIKMMLNQKNSIYDISLKVVYYARVSTDMDQQINSLENQVNFFENEIKKQNKWMFIKGYIDEGISGVEVSKRKQFLNMINDAKNGLFDLILTKEVSRFARNTIDSLLYTRELLKYGVGIYFYNDGILTFDTDSEFRLTIMASYAQEELRKISDRIKFGYQRSIESGKVAGCRLLGYKKNNGKLIIDKEESLIVKKIFEYYVYDRIGAQLISERLYKEGYKNKNGNPLCSSNIRRIIRNPKYMGFYCGKKSTSINYQTKKRIFFDKDKWILYKDFNAVPPIISEELWKEANSILDSRTKPLKEKVPSKKYSFTKKIYCSLDNSTYTRGYWNKNNKRYFWACSRYRKYGRNKTIGCNSIILYEDILYIKFKSILKRIIEQDKDLIMDIKTLLNSNKNKNTFNKKKKEIKQKKVVIENQKEELINMRANNEITSEEFLYYKEKYDNSINDLNNSYKNLTELENNNKLVVDSNNIKNIINNIIDTNIDSTLNIISSIITKIIVDNKKALLHCYFIYDI